MEVSIVEHMKAVAIKTAVTMIVHAKKVSIEVEGNVLFLLKLGIIFQRERREEFEKLTMIRMLLSPAALHV